MTDQPEDPMLMGLFAQSSAGPDDGGFSDAVGTRIRRYRLRHSVLSSITALICGMLAAAILSPLIARMIVSGDLVLALALFGCSLAALGITLIRAEG